VDYYETFAPVARLASIRIVLAIANRNGWPIDMFDVQSAYLNGELGEGEEIYMEQPPDREVMDRKKYVLKLRKTIYGLKQSGRKWYEAFSRLLVSVGLNRAESDYGIFYKRSGDDMVVIAIHVDDCVLAASSRAVLDEYKAKIGARFKLTDLGPIHWLLGIKVVRNLEARTLSLSQQSYIESILRRYNFEDLKPSNVPMDPSILYSKDQCPTSPADIAHMKKVPYREAIGSLMYAAIGTRPDIAFATSILAQFAENPGNIHWEGVKRVFRYLKGTKGMALVYGGVRRGLEGFTDADGASQEHRHAITGFAFLIDGGAVTWSSKKQSLVTLSTAEAEYVAASYAAREALWLRRFIGEVYRPLQEPTPLMCDNQSAITLAQSGNFHARTKHIDIRYHFIRFVVEDGHIRLVYCPTEDMAADTLTKALPSLKAKHFASALGLTV
jgi:hypothetical protein